MDTTLSAPIGQLLDGRYLVESQLARGGMATVYLARDVRLERTVALKIAHPELARDAEFVARFISEARSVARLSSPNVVAVFDQGSTGDLHYIAMEYVPGPTLRQLLQSRGLLSPREALDIIERVLAGLAVAHHAGIIHRDVKPENVLLGTGSNVKVADFGLARAASGVSHTRTGLLIGTAAYLAPEQVASNTSDQRSDVYAAGVMLFEMLTGVQPHTGESPLAVAYKHVNAVVPAPSSLVPELPAALDTLVALATARDPELRPADARQYLKAVTEVRRGMPLPPSGSPGDDGGHANGQGNISSFPSGPAMAGGALAAGLLAATPASGQVGDDTDGLAAGADHGGAGGLFTRQLGTSSGYDTGAVRSGVHHTMVVPGGFDAASSGGGHRGGRRPRTGEPREPWLQRWLFSRRILVVLAVVVIGIGVWWFAAGQYLSVPAVVSLPVASARSDLTAAGLTPVTGPGRHSNTVPAGDVIATNPLAGSHLTHGGTVTITPSLGPVLIAVPSVTGQSLAQADKALRAVGLIPAKPVYQTSASIPADVVMATNPVAYQHWPANRPVQLVVSDGPPLPDFAGQQVAEAQATASAGGYSINAVTMAKSDQPAGTIVHQSPKAGSPITAGEVVTVYVSPGPPQVPVPPVQGMTVHQAEEALTQAGFQVSVDSTGFGNRVMSYSPTGQAPQGSTITLIVGFGF